MTGGEDLVESLMDEDLGSQNLSYSHSHAECKKANQGIKLSQILLCSLVVSIRLKSENYVSSS